MKVTVIAALLAVGAASASAADLPIFTKAPPPPVAVVAWTGCYVGANGGGVWADKRWVNSDTTTPNLIGTEITRHTASGGMGGGQIGCDYQTSRWVFGVRGDFDGVNATGSGIDNNNPRFRDESNVRGLGTLTVRAGYTVSTQFLLYASGGIAFERDRYNVYLLSGGALTTQVAALNPGVIATGDQSRTGGVVSVGGEYLITNHWSVFAEASYLDFGTQTITLQSTQAARAFLTTDIRERKEVVRAGFNYRFNTASPVVAKY
jgi:outer membrane immunogenic protein